MPPEQISSKWASEDGASAIPMHEYLHSYGQSQCCEKRRMSYHMSMTVSESQDDEVG